MSTSTQILPCFSNMSSMHRVFGDPVSTTEIRIQPNILGDPILHSGPVAIRIRSFFWKPTFAPWGTVTKRYECYYDGVLVDYSLEAKLIIRTFRWLSKKGQINIPQLTDRSEFKHGDRVELCIDLDDLKAGMKGNVHVDGDRTGVWFDGMCSISIGRIPNYPAKRKYIHVIECVKKI